MNFLRQLANLFSGGGRRSGNNRYLTIYVLSRRCNEPVMGQVDLLNELSQPDEGDYAFHTRKGLHTSGERRCFAQVEVSLYFDSNKKVVHHEVQGGTWLTADEYYVELERFNTPPEEPEEVETAPDATTTPTAEHRSSPEDSSAAQPPSANP